MPRRSTTTRPMDLPGLDKILDPRLLELVEWGNRNSIMGVN